MAVGQDTIPVAAAKKASTDPATTCVKPQTPITQVNVTITKNRPVSAKGSIHTSRAITQPAKTPRSNANLNPTGTASPAIEAKAARTSGGNASVFANTVGMTSDPARFDSNTTVHKRAT